VNLRFVFLSRSLTVTVALGATAPGGSVMLPRTLTELVARSQAQSFPRKNGLPRKDVKVVMAPFHEMELGYTRITSMPRFGTVCAW